MAVKYQIILVTALITALMVGGAFFFLGGRDPGDPGGQAELENRIAALEAEIAGLESEVAGLESEVAALEAEKEELQDTLKDHTEIFREAREGWEQYFPDPETTTLTGEPVEDVRALLGEPPYLVRSIAKDPTYSREIWVYTPFEEDPTGLYLFFKGGQLERSLMDEFPGLQASFIWGLDDFWK